MTVFVARLQGAFVEFVGGTGAAVCYSPFVSSTSEIAFRDGVPAGG